MLGAGSDKRGQPRGMPVSSGSVPGRVAGVASDDELRAALDEMAAATDRLLASVDQLTEGSLTEPSLLPGWTRGHVLTHIARNADAMVNLVHAARTGDGRPMYPGGREGRDADIEAGSGRELGDQRLDIAESAERLLGEFAGDFPAEARDREVEMRAGATVFGWELPLLRIREVEIHHVDLDAGYTPDDWSADFAARTLDQVAPLFRTARDCPVGSLIATDTDARWEVAADGPELSGPIRDLAAWLVGRSHGPGRRGLRLDPPGELPTAPPWT
jgi:maleylpyruvate isomerase